MKLPVFVKTVYVVGYGMTLRGIRVGEFLWSNVEVG